MVTGDSALPTSSKFSILVSEGCRRLRNTIPCLLTADKRKEILTEFNFWLTQSGQSYSFRKKVTERVITVYESWVSLADEENISISLR